MINYEYQIAKSKDKILSVISSHFSIYFHKTYGWGKSFGFYAWRLLQTPNYGLYQGREIIKMVCRCAFNDSCLTDAESIAIIETCLDPLLDNILMEVNYNEGW